MGMKTLRQMGKKNISTRYFLYHKISNDHSKYVRLMERSLKTTCSLRGLWQPYIPVHQSKVHLSVN